MSRQFHLYLLPEDAEDLMRVLRSKVSVVMIESVSSQPIPKIIESPFVERRLQLKNGVHLADCHLIPTPNSGVKTRFVPSFDRWLVENESEAIEFGGCEFDGTVLLRGRFYFQTDYLLRGMVVPKRKEFLEWADKIFRISKKSLIRSKAIDAYVGQAADAWRKKGGKFASMVTASRGPIFELDPTR
jgi:hypothetical protein